LVAHLARECRGRAEVTHRDRLRLRGVEPGGDGGAGGAAEVVLRLEQDPAPAPSRPAGNRWPSENAAEIGIDTTLV